MPMNPNDVHTPSEKEQEEAFNNVEDRVSAPPGYINVKLSTCGKVGAPKSFFVRNFSPEEILQLGLSDERDLQIRVLKALQSLIYNPDPNNYIDIGDFHEKEVVELMLVIYETFYQSIFPQQTWDLTEEDYEELKRQNGGDTPEYQEKVNAIKEGKWTPRFDLDISQAIDYYDISEDDKFSTEVSIVNSAYSPAFKAKFSLPRYGDFLKLKMFIDEAYQNEDRKYARLGQVIKLIEQAENDHDYTALTKLPAVSARDKEDYKEYEVAKAVFSTTATKALYLVEFDGKDVRHLPLKERFELAKDPRLDYDTFAQVQDKFNELKFGYKEEITALDPILNKVVQRPYTFRIMDFIIALQSTRSSKTHLSFE
ncbi:MAG: hypothetical protein HUJ68_07590 [Clostridia bacterium]|nr:hypothetical protein [Clostridia bacterium]